VAIPLFLLLVLGSSVQSSGRGPKVLNADVEGATPNVTIRSVTAGAAPWVVQEGNASVDQNGRFRVRVRGLLIAPGALANGNPVPANLVGTTAGITLVHAALGCGGPGGGVPFTFTSTDAVTLDSHGNFVIDQTVPGLPSPCDRPILLIRIGDPSANGAFIAATDPFSKPRGEGEDDNNQH